MNSKLGRSPHARICPISNLLSSSCHIYLAPLTDNFFFLLSSPLLKSRKLASTFAFALGLFCIHDFISFACCFFLMNDTFISHCSVNLLSFFAGLVAVQGGEEVFCTCGRFLCRTMRRTK